jgi:hypothetical protein
VGGLLDVLMGMYRRKRHVVHATQSMLCRIGADSGVTHS